LIVAVLTLGAILVVVAWVSRSISLPIQKMAEASLAVSKGDLDRKVIVDLRDELGELATRFNLMVGSLRESQRQLVQSERLAAIGELVASVVHEIRNPLSAIKMNLRILEHKCETSPAVAEHFELASAQMERLEGMLKDLLDFSKPVRIEKKPIPIGEIVNYAIRHVPDGMGNVQVEMKIKDPMQKITVDKDKIEQVLLNLLVNSKQATPGGGRITVTSLHTHDGTVITVTDTGEGISQENLTRLFEPFFTTRKHGTGLGLANAKKIVEAHGGQIRVKSAVNTGTEVEVELPIS
jgi:signal transduction histidine kinase